MANPTALADLAAANLTQLHQSGAQVNPDTMLQLIQAQALVSIAQSLAVLAQHTDLTADEV